MGPKKGPPPAKWAETGVSKNQKKKERKEKKIQKRSECRKVKPEEFF